MHRLDRLGVTVHVGVAIDAVAGDHVSFIPDGGTERRLEADTVLRAGDLRPGPELHDQLCAALPGIPVTAIGDATGLGLVRKATEDAARAVAALEVDG